MKKTLIIIAILILIAVGAILAIKYFKKKKATGSASTGTKPLPGTTMPPVSGNSATFPLKKGSKGIQVTALQHSLNALYGANLTEDGQFGAQTYNAVKSFLKTATVSEQQYNKLLADAKANGTPNFLQEANNQDNPDSATALLNRIKALGGG